MGLKEILDIKDRLLARHPELIEAEVRRLERQHDKMFAGQGDIVEGYEFSYPFAEGGFGNLCNAMNLSTGDIVVIKYPRPDLYFLNSERMDAIFEKEGALLQLLRHPNIVEAYAPFRHNGIPYIPMECMDMLLTEYISHNSDTASVLSFMRQGLEALKHVHGHNLVHCDVKINNFMADVYGTIKLADFGAAQVIGEEIGNVEMFTPGYFPRVLPKDEKGKDVISPSIDYHALGRSAGVLLIGIGGTGNEELKYVQKSASNEELIYRLRQQHTPEYLVAIIDTCLSSTQDSSISAKRIDDMLQQFAWENYPETVNVRKDLYSGRVSRIARA